MSLSILRVVQLGMSYHTAWLGRKGSRGKRIGIMITHNNWETTDSD